MRNQAWNWLEAILLAFAAGLIADAGYLLLQGKDMERGDWDWFPLALVCVLVVNLKNSWDAYVRSKNPADAPGLAIGQGPKVAGTD